MSCMTRTPLYTEPYMKRFQPVRIAIDEEGEAHMPCSEVCMHMRVASKKMKFRLVGSSAWGAAVQLLRENGTDYSAPILTGEAGIYRDENGYYYYPDLNK